LPYILGTNVAGIVQKLGPNVSTFCVGDRVFGEADVNYPTPDMAGLQEFAILDITATAKTPPNLTNDQVATLPVNVVTSFITLFTPSGFNFPSPFMKSSNADVSSFHNKSETLIIIGGGSNVGKLAIQLAKLAEIGTIIAIASGQREHELKGLGATHVIDRNSASIPAQARDIVESNRLTHVYDCVNWTYELALDILTSDRSSQLATLHPITEDMEQMIRQKRPQCQIKIIIGMSTNLEPFEKQFWQDLPQWLEQGKIALQKFQIIEGLDARKVNAALDSYEDGKAVLQAVVHPNHD